ncbi:MAG TPA: tetratricopeptide repeat protein, partial [Bryobacteraceae bacterium]|nr:tetratricopeptide repeat protein [Bryobacteraceae bacterium]
MAVYARGALVLIGVACLTAVPQAFSQTPAAPAASAQATPAGAGRSAAYYNFAMGHLYGEMADAYGNRGEYVNKAIDYYKEAMRLDPNSSYIGEELAEFYARVGQLERATQQAQDLLKRDPNNADAHKILARIFSRQMGDPDQGKIDPEMLRNATAEWRKVVELNPKDTESLSMLARLYVVAHDNEAAEKTYKQILDADPNDSDALGGLATLYANKGDFPKAIELLKQSVEKNPGDARSMVTLAEFYDQNKDYANAADIWKEALPLTNDNPKVRQALARDLAASNRLDDALALYQEMAKEDPKAADVQLQILKIYERKRDFPKAHQTLETLRGLSKGVEARFAEADLLDTEGKTAQAITVLQGILAETKKDNYSDQERAERIQTLDALADLQKRSGATQAAVATVRQISDLDPKLTPRVDIEVIDTLAQARDYKAAKQVADSALHSYPKDRDVIVAHASLLGNLGQADQAIAELRALPNAAKDPGILLAVANIQDNARRFEDEKATLEQAERLASSAQEKQSVSFRRGAMYEKEKKFEPAEAEFRKILAADPNNPGVLNYLGYMFAERGENLDEAQQMVAKALDLDPDNGAYLDSIGWVHFRQNRLEQAAEELERALDKIGKDPTVHEHLGAVYFKQGKIREAIRQWEASVSEWNATAPGEKDPDEIA